ncbi:MAG: Tol-Pal system beta propeller repeat protein TolB [Chitinivibrionales bacterium]|nr:Tol-Pal system beta propeller repeat protein TolB [Chitinivibrionales bacterium]
MRHCARVCAVPIVALAAFWNVRGEKIDLEVYASKFDSIPIAVLDFRPLNNIPLTKNEPWKVVADDLEFSGRFHVVRTAKVDTALFAEHGVGIFVDGEYAAKGDKVELDCYLHDAVSLDLVVGKKYRGEKRFVRSMAHRYANQLMEMLLGDRGPFESRIVYVQDKGATKNLVIMDFDGHNQKQLTSSNWVNVFPAFVDSNYLVWTSFYRGKPDIYKGSIATGKFKIFAYSRFVETSPAVSPVVGKVAYASSRKGNLDIYTCTVDGQERKQITFNRAIDTSPCWSPNGYQIAFTSDRSGQPQIYVMDADGVNTRRLTFKGKYQDSPAWSPKGDKIAYTSYQDGKFDIWIINPDGTEPARVTGMPGNNEYPTWSPDGSHIAFASTRGGRSDIHAVRPDGTGAKRLTRAGNAKMPDWSQF